jgi:polysaccharide export outer membrane protein
VSQSKIGFPVRPRRQALSRRARAPLAALAGLALASLGGCTQTDSWFDPSVTGYWEHTPTQVPILTRLSSIEGPEDEYVEVSEVAADDLTPDAGDYYIGPGDQVQIILWDVPTPGQPTPFERLVDHRGMVDIPQLGEVMLQGLTVEKARQAFERRLAENNLVNRDPLVSVMVINPMQRMFSFMGAVGSPGPRYIPRSDYRLLEAVADSGGIAETVREILIIRQIRVDQPGTLPAQPADAPANPQPDNEKLLDLIDRITDDAQNPGDSPGGSPGAFAAPAPALVYRQPTDGSITPVQPDAADSAETTWAFINNEWVRVQAKPEPDPSGAAQDGLPPVEEIVTQRVIRVPVPELLSGDPRYNIVVRPADVIRVPSPANGTIYIGGEINRPGAFSMAPGLTLTRVIDAAGGLSAVAMPERVDLIRMVGPDRQGMIRLDLRAINEGSQPDIFMKANDRVNIGTTFWAYPLAVARNGFRASYGYGFLLDRNFAQDVFGPVRFNG